MLQRRFQDENLESIRLVSVSVNSLRLTALANGCMARSGSASIPRAGRRSPVRASACAALPSTASGSRSGRATGPPTSRTPPSSCWWTGSGALRGVYDSDELGLDEAFWRAPPRGRRVARELTSHAPSHVPGLLLINLGTPRTLRIPEVRRYLREFLSDWRVLDVPWPVRWAVLHLAVILAAAAASVRAGLRENLDPGRLAVAGARARARAQGAAAPRSVGPSPGWR